MKTSKIVKNIVFGALMLGSASLSPAQAQGNSVGGGGSVTEADFSNILIKLNRYFSSAESQSAFPEVAKYDREHPGHSLAQLISKVKPVMVNQRLTYKGFARDCLARDGSSEREMGFTCDLQSLPEYTVANQPRFYQIALHEVLVIAGLERTTGSEVPSDYWLSTRILDNVHLETFEAWVPGKVDIRSGTQVKHQKINLGSINWSGLQNFSNHLARRIDTYELGIGSFEPGGTYRGYAQVKGAVIYGGEIDSSMNGKSDFKNPELRRAGITIVPFEIQVLDNGRKMITAALLKIDNTNDAMDMGFVKELTAFQILHDTRNPNVQDDRLTFGIKMVLPLLTSKNELDFVGPKVDLDLGASNVTYQVKDLNLPGQLAQIKTFRHQATGVFISTVVGLAFQKTLPRSIVIRGDAAMTYQRTGKEDPVDLTQHLNQGTADYMSIQSVRSSAVLNFEVSKPTSKTTRLGVFYNGSFLQRARAQGNFLNRDFDLSPLVKTVPHQIGVRFSF